MILLFVGAGGSSAVDSERFPTTLEFFRRIPRPIKSNSQYRKAVSILSDRKGGMENIDVEELLWVIDEIVEQYSEVVDPDRPISHLGKDGHINELVTAEQLASFNRHKREVIDLRNQIYRLVHDYYSQSPDQQRNPWTNFLKGLIEMERPLEIFTTNYDLIFESTNHISQLGLEIGKITDREFGSFSILDESKWDTPARPPGRLTKLHGSLGWRRRKDGEIEFNTGVDSQFNPVDYGVLYPGYKGRPLESPFGKFYDSLAHTVAKADVMIFVGYSFRDDDINELLEIENKQARVLVIGNTERAPEKMPLSSVVYLKDGFGVASSKVCLRYIARFLKRR